MNHVELIAPCHFGLEAVLKREIKDLGYDIVQVEDGRVTFRTDLYGIARANIFLRTAERILLKIGSFKAFTFDELFEEIKKLPWEDFIPKDGRFWVKKASTAKSRLFSGPDIQSIVKKAVVERLKGKYHVSWFSEEGDDYPIRVFILKDQVTVSLDTTGTPLHKRGYRKLVSEAPIRETLAASLLMLTPWNKDRILVDPFCGSGTFLIEAAMMGMNMAPGMNRSFEAENWTEFLPKKAWYEAIDEADSLINYNVEMDLQGYDKDSRMLKIARQNAADAEVDHLIHFQQREVKDLSHSKPYGFIIANPPYGERLEDRETLPVIYQQMKEAFDKLDTWSKYVITSYEDTEKYLGKPTKKRKVYNGMIRGEFYQYLGPKPPRRKA
ncbi:N-6 DNA methylase [Anaerostipes sp. 494a]|uniref:THUMP domain-containing class I SAM-dependent RNA methyltransferase n=1 Tax=unclassified Anaerostipes TaxID=2635253 RepID=UPI00095306D3|nr:MULTISPECIES: class I SAM-dependent RNA methyltransferase [unclassified Anaerostipes]MCI5623150.1 class I SAM-dependent RNA methyltransferase [Anaerostipes sp.]MDY2725433.1 class I SAM-dependent RNA methyltransferase [Anaerostipes faecalis]OLR59087.1 N-6 DNA methylase [Anaerostipes sp. 494a]